MHTMSKYLHFLCDSLLAVSCLAQPISIYGMGLSVMDCYDEVCGGAYSTSNVSRGFGANSIANAIVCNYHGLQKNVGSISKINIVREATTRSGVRYIYIYAPAISADENEIKKLAAMLNNKFTKYKKIRAIIFDKYALARFWAFGSYDDVTDLEVDARVVYFLNRTTSEEYIQYSSERGKSVLEKKIVVHEKKVSLRRAEGTPMIRGAVDMLAR